MLEPLSSAPLVHRAIVEIGAYLGLSALALSITTAEVSIGFMIVTGVIGVVVWLVRLEGRINTQAAVMDRVEKHQQSSAVVITKVQITVAKIAGHIGVEE